MRAAPSTWTVPIVAALAALTLGLSAGCGDGDTGGSTTGADATDGDTQQVAIPDVACESNTDCVDVRSLLGECDLAICDTAAGLCVVANAEEGAPCNDGDPCTVQSSCVSGACAAAPDSEANCDDGNPCTADSCIAGQGCSNEPTTDACSDGDPCTTGDTCVDGDCVGSSSGACSCSQDADCAAFEDGNWCNGALRCIDDQCQVDPSTVVLCEASDATCTNAQCDPATGACGEVPVDDGTPCDDGDPCTGGDACAGGTCGGEPACTCETDDDCVPHEDDDLCNGTLICGEGSTCVADPATVVTCEDDGADECTSPVCEPATGTCVATPVTDGTACGADDPCLTGKVCDNGACVGGNATDCDDGNGCTLDLCVAGSGCEYQPASGQPCDDGDECTGDDLCEFTDCIGATILCVCGDGFCSVAEQQGCFCTEDCGNCAQCGDGSCDPGEEVDCPQDCSVCGDGVCAADESPASCPADCDGGGGGGGCGDGFCDAAALEALTCPQDCCGDGVCDPFGEVLICPADCCGDGACDALFEDINTCPEDCGPQNDCGNGICESPVEGAGSCPEDCAVCGDDECSTTEDIDSCPEDCTPPPVCGDGECAEGEDAVHCPDDCGVDDGDVVEDLDTIVDEDAVVDDDIGPVDDDATPVDDDATPVDDDVEPPLDDADPVDDDATPVDDDALTVEDVGPDPDDATGEAMEVTELELTATDDTMIAARSWKLPSTAEGAPGVLLVHQFQETKEQWDAYVPELVAHGWIVIAIDLRGHGASGPQTGALTDLLSDPVQAPLDVQAGLAWLVGDGGADPTRIAVVGTSIGANLACVASANGYGALVSVAVSARDTATASLADKALADLTFSGLFILATEDDGDGAQAATADAFFEVTTEPKQKMVLPGTAHGKNLLLDHPDAVQAIYTFLDDNLVAP